VLAFAVLPGATKIRAGLENWPLFPTFETVVFTDTENPSMQQHCGVFI
jgi:hypothetical protein